MKLCYIDECDQCYCVMKLFNIFFKCLYQHNEKAHKIIYFIVFSFSSLYLITLRFLYHLQIFWYMYMYHIIHPLHDIYIYIQYKHFHNSNIRTF